jgi:putative transposase
MNDLEIIGRRKPATGVMISESQPTIAFVTICTHQRVPWLIEPAAHQTLLNSWTKADAWVIGYYLLMPDHIHLFCAPHNRQIPLNNWVTYWKSIFTKATRSIHPKWQWQSNMWDTRLRRSESYQQKWNYVRENPVRKKLVATPEDWPLQGMLNPLRW